MTTSEKVLIELDDRRRGSLGKLGRHTRYLAREEPDGTLILEPAVVLTEAEAKRLIDGASLAETR